MTEQCPFCPIHHLTDWYNLDGTIKPKWDVKPTFCHLVACMDLHNRIYQYRILVVMTGLDWHKPFSSYSPGVISLMENIGLGIAKAHIKKGFASKVENVDKVHLSEFHWHLQIGIR